jgi:hypothetical protein
MGRCFCTCANWPGSGPRCCARMSTGKSIIRRRGQSLVRVLIYIIARVHSVREAGGVGKSAIAIFRSMASVVVIAQIV